MSSTTVYLLVGTTILFFDAFSQNLIFLIGFMSGAAALALPKNERSRVFGCAVLVLFFAFVAQMRGDSSLALGSAIYSMLIARSVCSSQGTVLVGLVGAVVIASPLVLTATGASGAFRTALPWSDLLVFSSVILRLLSLANGHEQQRDAAQKREAAARFAWKTAKQETLEAQRTQKALSARLAHFESPRAASGKAFATAQDLSEHQRTIPRAAVFVHENAPFGDDKVEAACHDIPRSSETSSTLAEKPSSTPDEDRSSFQPVELHGELRAIARHLRRTLATSVQVVLQATELPSTVWADRNLLHQALMNICINAVEAMPEGGTLTLSLGRKGLDVLQISIADSGGGIHPQIQARVFNPFFTTKDGHRSGLGLTTAKAIVENQGGTIDLESAWKKGTVVIVSIPTSTSARLAVVSGTYTRVAEPPPGTSPIRKKNA